MEFTQFRGKNSRGDYETKQIKATLKFPESEDLGKIRVTIGGPDQVLFSGDYAATTSNDGLWLTFKDARDGADFEVSVNGYGDVNVRLWTGYASSIAERHAITDYRHALASAHAEANGATLRCVGDGQGFSERCKPSANPGRYRTPTSCEAFLRDFEPR